MIFTAAKKTIPIIYQRESSECLLACIAMLAKYWNDSWSLPALRKEHQTSVRGSTAEDGIRILRALGFDAYASRIDIEDLEGIDSPMILHWKFRHYVVFCRRKGKRFVINDPAEGMRTVSLEEFSEGFTGVALIAFGPPTEKPKQGTRTLRLLDLMPKQKAYFRLFAEVVGLTLATQVAVLLLPISMKSLFDLAEFNNTPLKILSLAILAYLAISIYSTACASLRQWAIARAEHMLAPILTGKVFDRLFSLPTAFIRRRPSTDLASRFGSIEVFRIIFSKGLVESVIDITTLGLVIVASFLMWPQIAGITVTAAVLYTLIRVASIKYTKTLTENLLHAQAQHEGSILETIKGYHVIQAAGAISERREHWFKRYTDFLSYSKRMAAIYGVLTALRAFIPAVEMAVVLAVGLLAIHGGMATIGALVAFMAYRQKLFDLCTNATEKVASWQELQVHLDRLSDVWYADEPSSITVTEDDALVRLRHVAFKHSGEARNLLHDVNITIQTNCIVAISGKTGSGKTTLMNLIIGHERPTSGLLEMHSELSAAPGRLCVIFQDDIIFNSTILENVTLGQASDPGLVEAALADACLLDEVLTMPTGLESHVGEGGVFLSGGQRQRLIIARALYRNPQLLALDEATSHLDVETERRILEHLRRRVPAIVMVTHRPDTIAIADIVYLVKDGRVTNVTDKRPRELCGAA